MIGVLLLSHGSFCEQLIDSTSMIAGPLEKVQAVPLNEGDSPDMFNERVRNVIEDLDSGAGVLVLVDILGGTPYNQAGSLSRDLNIQVITGMNMPMLLQTVFERDKVADLNELTDQIAETGKDAIRVLRYST